MKAVIKTGGKQYLVSEGDKIRVEKLDKEEGKEVTFSDVLLVQNRDKVDIGKPYIKGIKVTAKILKQDKAKKVIVFKFKAKKRYSVKRGHRQPFSLIEILKIGS